MIKNELNILYYNENILTKNRATRYINNLINYNNFKNNITIGV